ncbi:MAG: hypothetical protein L0Y71_07780 [Gemmataceae bacterium]|nr:hypothetical protein [Gemmataceae bacterium]
MPRFELVVSAENNAYLVWQAMLFHYSCLHYQRQTPIVVVHKDDEPLLPGFERIRAAGGIVQTAPNYRGYGGVHYPPRNTAATLRHVVSAADYLVVFDPDMIFTQPLPLDDLGLTSRQITFDRLTYLDPDGADYQPALDETSRRAGVAPERLRARPINGGVPHVVPRELQERLSDDWLACMDLFPTIEPRALDEAGAASRACHIGPHKDWLATMWALVLAVHRLGLEAVLTDWCALNYEGHRPLREDGSEGRMVHYCYSDAGFDKRDLDKHVLDKDALDSRDAAELAAWQVAPGDDTISGTVRKQFHEAKAFYRQADTSGPRR